MWCRSFVCVCVLVTAPVAFDARELTADPVAKAAVFSGRIVRSDGGPVAGAKVTLHEALVGEPRFEIRVLAETTSAADGAYRFSIAVGDTPGREGPPYGTIVAQKEGLSIGWASWPNLHLDRKRDIALTEPKGLAGTVVDGQGRPVPDAGVYTVGGPSDGQKDRQTRTDGEGRFRLEGLCAGLVRLQASAQIEGAALYANLNTDGRAADVRIVLAKSN
jgi:hypothetical protein